MLPYQFCIIFFIAFKICLKFINTLIYVAITHNSLAPAIILESLLERPRPVARRATQSVLVVRDIARREYGRNPRTRLPLRHPQPETIPTLQQEGLIERYKRVWNNFSNACP